MDKNLTLALLVLVAIGVVLVSFKYFSKTCPSPTPCPPCSPCPPPTPCPTPQPIPQPIPQTTLTVASAVDILNNFKLDNEGMMQVIVSRLTGTPLTQQDVNSIISQYNLVQGTGKYILKSCPENDPSATFVFFYDRTLGSVPPCPF